MRLILGSHNAHKREEIEAVLAGTGVAVLDLARFPDIEEIPEDEPTFEGNALHKARVVFARTGLPAVADDSGLVVDALGGAPGVISRRWTPEAAAASNNARLLREMAGVSDRRARFVCAMALVTAAGERVVVGTCEGRIAEVPRGMNGFGYDPLFLPDETPGRTMAELTAAEKNAISHRGRAFGQLPALLQELSLQERGLSKLDEL